MLSEYILISNEHSFRKFETQGTINYLWQSWNKFWRKYWLCSFTGYIDRNNNKIAGNGILTTRDFDEIIYYILFLLRKRKIPGGRITGSFQEPTWGARESIINIANALFSLTGNYNIILSLVSSYAQSIDHLHYTRNAIIHVDRYSMNNIKTNVLPHYTLTDINQPTDIIFAYPIADPVVAYKKWINDLSGFVENII